MKAAVVAAAVSSCGGKPEITEAMLDGEVIFDPSIAHPEKYLVSVANPHPSGKEHEKPVFIAAHGYTATTFEWDEFRDWLDENQKDVYLSQVLLGGHGTDYENFRETSWDGWQQAIMDEYSQLQNAGYTNLNLVGSSAGGALIMDLVAKGLFCGKYSSKKYFSY